MAKQILRKDQTESEPWTIWNAFIRVIAADPDNLTEEQRPAHFVFVYENEIQNGGHLQYFENQGSMHLQETLAALTQLGANNHRRLLEQASGVLQSRPRKQFLTTEEYIGAALEDEFGIIDSQFHESSPSLQELLEKHLAENQSAFIEIV